VPQLPVRLGETAAARDDSHMPDACTVTPPPASHGDPATDKE
jgi:hypothetical protein